MPAGRSMPPSVVSCVVIRRHEIWLDSYRSVSSTAAAASDGSAHSVVPLVAAGQQTQQGVAQQRGDRVVAGERDAVDDRFDLAVADAGAVRRVGVGVVGVEQLGREVVGALVAPLRRRSRGSSASSRACPRRSRPARSAVGLPHENARRLTHHDLIIASSSGGKPMNRNTISAGSGNASAATYSAGEPSAIIWSSSIGGPVAHVVLERLQSPIREALSGVGADAAVVGLGPVRHHGDRVEVGRGQDRPPPRRRSGKIGSCTLVDAYTSGFMNTVSMSSISVDDDVAEVGRRRTRGARRAVRSRSGRGRSR